jgi:SAM-dependent methyltransferase
MESDDGTRFSSQGYNCDRHDFVVPFERSVAELVTPGMRVLEIGCGIGRFIDLCLARGAGAVVAVEPRATMRHKLLAWSSNAGRADREGRLRFIHATWPEAVADVGDRTFDLVFSQSSLHYLDEDRRALALGRIRRALKPGGIFALSVRSIDCSWFEEARASREAPDTWVYQDGFARKFFTLAGLLRELTVAGFPVQAGQCTPRTMCGYGRDEDIDVWLDAVVRLPE